jgi:hypothetical protein
LGRPVCRSDVVAAERLRLRSLPVALGVAAMQVGVALAAAFVDEVRI